MAECETRRHLTALKKRLACEKCALTLAGLIPPNCSPARQTGASIFQSPRTSDASGVRWPLRARSRPVLVSVAPALSQLSTNGERLSDTEVGPARACWRQVQVKFSASECSTATID